MPAPPTWSSVVRAGAGTCTAPGGVLFEQLVPAWVRCPGRHTLTRLWSVIPEPLRHPYSADARWIRVGRWSPERLGPILVVPLVRHSAPTGPLTGLLDDTLIHRSGPHVDGAGGFRDAVRATATRTVLAWGLNVVILALRVQLPWGGEPLALPVGVRGGSALANDTVRLPVTLKDGTVLTDQLLDAQVREAEAGYDPTTLRPAPGRPGRPALSPAGISPRVQFRAPADVYALARARAAHEGRTVSAALRDLLAAYARGEGPPKRVR